MPHLYFQPCDKQTAKCCGSKDEAFDITQQVFVQAMLNLKKYEFRGLPFSAWLYRMAVNELNMLFRKNKIQRTVSVNENEVQELKTETYSGISDDEKLFQAISQLENDDVHLIEMRYFEKRSFAEIGDILDITENNAKVKTYRVLDKLRKVI